MKSSYFFLIVLLIISNGCKNTSSSEIYVVTAEEMEAQLKYDNMQVVDVRSDNEYKESHLLNATNIIYNKDFRKNLEKLDKTRPVAIYCTTGSVSPEAARILQEAGFKNIYLLDGGIKKWETVKSDSLQR